MDAILDAAARILEVDGLAAANTNRIAERAGVSVGSLYQYFPNKEAIYAELIRRSERTMTQMVQASVEQVPEEDFERQIETGLRSIIAHQFARPTLERTLSYLEATLGLDREESEQDRRIVELIARHLTEHGKRHAHANCSAAARDLFGIVKGMIDAALQFDEVDRAGFEERVILAVFGYLYWHPLLKTQHRV